MHTASDLKPKPGDEDIACMRITSLNYILSEAIAPPDNGVLWGGVIPSELTALLALTTMQATVNL